jgi:hypothetical protein
MINYLPMPLYLDIYLLVNTNFINKYSHANYYCKQGNINLMNFLKV